MAISKFKKNEDEMIFKNFRKNTFVSGFSVALVLMCFSATPSLAKGSKIALKPGAISFSCVSLRESFNMKHFEKIRKEMKIAQKRGNPISEIILEDCFIEAKTVRLAQDKLNRVERKCLDRSIGKNCAIGLKFSESQGFSDYLKYTKMASDAIHYQIDVAAKATEASKARKAAKTK